ncbi:hypothetical protein Cni_G19312 [Canna indica]|uniref:DUF4283 domain-containing protein n=1 Tax=Canna indica TaxID=4628 RepID=A0AAQ3KKW7_9LILI|nr:hypothetical protein Cni_G19312 [Canna indica]
MLRAGKDDAGDLGKKPPDPISSGQVWISKEKKPSNISSADGKASAPTVNVDSNPAMEKMGNVVLEAMSHGSTVAGVVSPSIEERRVAADALKQSGSQSLKPGKNPILDKRSSSNKPSSWAALFKEINSASSSDGGKQAESKIKAIQEGSSYEIEIEEELIEHARLNWVNCLYGKFFSNPLPPLGLIQAVMPKIWKLKFSMQTIDLASDFYCFKFSNHDDMNHVISNGPWFLNGQVLLLIPWKPNFQPLLEKIETIPVWVQLPGLPVEYIHREILFKITSALGQPVKIDEITVRGLRGKYARVCILWKLDKKMPNGIWINCKGCRF